MISKNNNKKIKTNNLPTSPGIYQFFDQRGKILYIGKAKNLRVRIRSYFLIGDQVKGRSSWISEMTKKVSKIKTIQTDSEIEAVLLEAELINRIKPKYNTRQKDDKSYSVIEISKENIPKVEIRRVKNVNLKDKNFYYFGPFTSGDILKRAMKILRKIFPYANCSKTKFGRQQKLSRPCLYGDINLCLSPCVGDKNILESKKQIYFLRFFLSGKKKKIISNFEKEMIVLSCNKKYEDAAIVRDKIYTLNHLNRFSIGVKDNYLEILDNSIFPRIEAYDISNIAGNFSVGAMTVLSLGKIDKNEYKKFKIKTVANSNDLAMTREVIIRRLKNNWQKPDLIVVDGGMVHLKIVAEEIIKAYSSCCHPRPDRGSLPTGKAGTNSKIQLSVDSRLRGNDEKGNENCNDVIRSEIPVVAIAKGLDRKKDEFHFSSTDLAKVFQKNPELKNLAIIARNEAHRFSREYYRKLHRKSIVG